MAALSKDAADSLPYGDASAAEDAALGNQRDAINGNLDAAIESLRPLKPMQAFLSEERVDKVQRHRQRPAKESSTLPETIER